MEVIHPTTSDACLIVTQVPITTLWSSSVIGKRDEIISPSTKGVASCKVGNKVNVQISGSEMTLLRRIERMCPSAAQPLMADQTILYLIGGRNVYLQMLAQVVQGQ